MPKDKNLDITSKKTQVVKKSKSTKTTKATNTKVTKTSTKAKKTTANKTTISKSSKTNLSKELKSLSEYYDLPYRYNQTVVKILAQTPTMLFIYWDISTIDREKFIELYGNDFFNFTCPYLVIHNITMDYTFEIIVDDFANSWYLPINDPNCKYSIELIRKRKQLIEVPISESKTEIPKEPIFIASSNKLEVPNNKVLFDISLDTVYFKNIKNNKITSKNIPIIKKNIETIYNVFHKSNITTNINSENTEDTENTILNNPSSIFKTLI